MSTTGGPLETGTTPALAETESFVSDKYHEMGKVMEPVCKKCSEQTGRLRCKGTCGLYCKHCETPESGDPNVSSGNESDLINYFNLIRFIDSIASDPNGSNVNEPESEAPNVTGKSKEADELLPILRDIFYEWAESGKKPPVWSAIKKKLTDGGFHEGVIDFKEPEIMDFFTRMALTYPWADHPKGDWRPEESEKVLFLAGSQAPWNRLAGKKGGSYKRKYKKRKSKKKKTRRRRSRR